MLERCDRRGMLAPPTPTRLAPSVRVPTPFDWREPKLCPCPVPHLASSAFLVSVYSVALFFPLLVLLVEEPVGFPLRELPAPRKAAGRWMCVSYGKVIDVKKVLTFGSGPSSGGDGGTYEGILKPKNNFPKGRLRGAGFFPSFSRSSFTMTRC